MFKVTVPKDRHAEEDDQRKNFQEMLGVIEPFYANLNSLFDFNVIKRLKGHPHISVELIAKNGLIYFYIGCPRSISEMVLKNIHAQYPYAEIEEDKNYSIFPPDKALKIDILNLGGRSDGCYSSHSQTK